MRSHVVASSIALLGVAAVPAPCADIKVSMTVGELPVGGAACYELAVRVDAREGKLAYCDGSRWWTDVVSATAHGARGDGATDDTEALRAALAAAGPDGRVFLPAGTYLVSPTPGRAAITLGMSGGIEVFGEGPTKSVLKVKDAAGSYFCLLGGTQRDTDLTGLHVHHLGFDHNVAANPRSAYPEGFTDSRLSVCAYHDSSNVRIHDIRVSESSAINDIAVNGTGVSNVQVYGNAFESIGGDDGLRGTQTGPQDATTLTDDAASWEVDGLVGRMVINRSDGSFGAITANTRTTISAVLQGGVDDDWDTGDAYVVPHDASTIYIHAAGGGGIYIADNTFAGESPAAPGARTAIETHGSHTLVTRNAVRDFMKGANITGITTADTTDVLVSGNTIEGALLGIELWSGTYRDHTAGYGLDGVTVEANTIELAGRGAWGGAGSLIEGGVVIARLGETVAFDELDVREVKILDNVISHPPEEQTVRNVGGSMGIGWLSQNDRAMVDSRIEGNTIVDFPMAGIRLSCGVRNVSVVRNLLIRTGSTLDDTLAVGYRSPIFVWGAPIDGLLVADNTIVDDQDPARTVYGIYLGLETGQGAVGLEVMQNAVRVSGPDRSRFKRALFVTPTLLEARAEAAASAEKEGGQ